MDVQLTDLVKVEDERGFLVEFLKGVELEGETKTFGQVYLTTINPGYMRGNHYHERSFEYFTVMHGRIRLILTGVKSKESMELILDAADKPLKRVRYGPYTAHVLHNISDSVAVVVSYSTKIYDKDHRDQIPYTILSR